MHQAKPRQACPLVGAKKLSNRRKNSSLSRRVGSSSSSSIMPSQFSFSSARLCRVQKLQFGILGPDEVVSVARFARDHSATPTLLDFKNKSDGASDAAAVVRNACGRATAVNSGHSPNAPKEYITTTAVDGSFAG